LLERVKTGIAELDEMLGGGFIRGDAVLIVGSAGTGKTTLGLQYVVNGVNRFNENGMFVTFEELPEQLYRDALNFGWDLQTLESENKLRVVCTSPELLLERSGDAHLLDEPIRQVKPRRIVVDSLSQLEMHSIGDFRKQAYELIRYFKTKKLSSMLTWEVHDLAGGNALTQTGLSFLADAVIPLRYVEIDSAMRKALAVLKLRGSDHDKCLREFEITSEGIKVANPFRGFEGIISGSPRKTPTGKRPS
jgi:circadian clock protein KaiC